MYRLQGSTLRHLHVHNEASTAIRKTIAASGLLHSARLQPPAQTPAMLLACGPAVALVQHLLLLPLGSAAALLLHPLQARVPILDGPGSAWAPHPWPLHAAWALALPAGAWVDGWVDAWAGCAGGAGKGGACAGAGGSGGTGCGLRRSQAFTWPPKHAVNMRFCRNSRSDPGSTCILQEQNARVRGSRDKG